MADARLLTESEAAGLLGMKPRFLEIERRRRRITFVKLGRHVRYRAEDVDAYLARGVVEARA